MISSGRDPSALRVQTVISEPSAEKHEKLTALAHRLVTRDAMDAILLAGTDLTLLFNESNTDFPHVDCAALHIRGILQQVTGRMPSGGS